LQTIFSHKIALFILMSNNGNGPKNIYLKTKRNKERSHILNIFKIITLSPGFKIPASERLDRQLPDVLLHGRREIRNDPVERLLDQLPGVHFINPFRP
jgi:hypothetical protein